MWLLIAGLTLAFSLLAFVACCIDKRAAIRGSRRIRESSLHLLALLGGWPGLLVGQHVFRHKTIKRRFRMVLWSIILLHAALWCAMFWFGR